jgi:hypothetical protein
MRSLYQRAPSSIKHHVGMVGQFTAHASTGYSHFTTELGVIPIPGRTDGHPRHEDYRAFLPDDDLVKLQRLPRLFRWQVQVDGSVLAAGAYTRSLLSST